MENRKELLSFAFFGMLTTAVDLLSFSLLLSLNLNIFLANSVSWILAVLFAFASNKYFVFNCSEQTNRTTLSEFWMFLASRGFAFCLSSGLLYLFMNLLTFKVFESKVLVTGMVLGFNYLASKYLIFKTA